MVGSRDDVDWLKEIVPGSNPAIDIVAVHGLNPKSKVSHANNTWTVDNKFWLKDFLPDRIPNARILLFSYNSKVTIGANLMGIEEHARNLLLRLGGKRKDDPDRPLLFIAHSLGGIVVKRALVEAQLNSMYESIRRSTYGLAFFGTPHHGGNHGDVVEIAVGVVRTVLRSPRTVLIENLRKNSGTLNTLFNDFSHQLENYKMLSFYETKPVNIKGFNHVIVDKKSAQFGLPGTREQVIALNLDHSEISRFADRESGDYELVESLLCDMAREAVRLRPRRPLISSKSTGPRLESRPQYDQFGAPSQPWMYDPIFLVPHSNVRNFVGREDILKRLEEHLFMPSGEVQPRAALYGLGGVGKTQIAKRLASQIHKHYPDVSIFWIDASNSELFHQSLVRLTRALSIPGADQPRADVMSLFKDWVSNRKCGKWFMIIDQLDDTKTFRASLQNDARTNMHLERLKDADLIPDHPDGAILITTRDMKVAVQTECGVSIRVAPLEKREAIELVQLTLKQGHRSEEHDQEALDSLVETLDRFPAPIDQAAKYILENMIDLPSYLQKFQNKDDAFLKFRRYSNVSGEDDRGRDVSNTTWLMSFEKLKETNPDSVDLLFLMAFLDRINIPETILRQHKQELPTSTFAEACGRLKSFSLLEEAKVEDEKVFTVPRMVQDHVQSWLRCHGDEEQWIGHAVAALVEVLPSPDGENWSSIEGYSQHVKALLGHFPNPMPASEQLATLLHRFSGYHRILGYHASAETYGREALRMRKQLLGDQDLATISSTTNVSRILLEQDQLQEAEALQVPVAELCLTTLGLQNRETIDAVRHLVTIRGMQERYSEAEELELQILEASKIQFEFGVDTLRAMRDLAVIYSFQERYDAAEELQKEVYEKFKETSGDFHPETLIVMSDLAKTYAFQQRFEEAEILFRQILDRSLQVLGREHPHTRSTVRNLESILKFQCLKKDPADLKRMRSLYHHPLSRRLRPQPAPLGSTERSRSDSIVTIGNGGLIYQSTFAESTGSAETDSLRETEVGTINGSEKLVVKFPKLWKTRWKNVTATAVTVVEETGPNCDAKTKLQIKTETDVFESGSETDEEQPTKAPHEDTDSCETPYDDETDAERHEMHVVDTVEKLQDEKFSFDTANTTEKNNGEGESPPLPPRHGGEGSAKLDKDSKCHSKDGKKLSSPNARQKIVNNIKSESAKLQKAGAEIAERTKNLITGGKKSEEDLNAP